MEITHPPRYQIYFQNFVLARTRDQWKLGLRMLQIQGLSKKGYLKRTNFRGRKKKSEKSQFAGINFRGLFDSRFFAGINFRGLAKYDFF